MTKLRRLINEAKDSCRFRGHQMKRFRTHSCFAEICSSTCKICDMQVVVKSKPAPNDIDIGGEAVALHCRGK